MPIEKKTFMSNLLLYAIYPVAYKRDLSISPLPLKAYIAEENLHKKAEI